MPGRPRCREALEPSELVQQGAGGNPLGLSVVCGSFGASATVMSHFLLVLRSFLATGRKCAITIAVAF
jgi:hypothetical protein